ncbi:hypothetical protein [Colwellia maritima]|uniref:hypothetical protein n=1 Tax=Colwellia maritima TaxID=2912588 RepID=UPI00308452D2
MLLPQYQDLATKLAHTLPKERIITSYAKRLAFGVDASFYRLVPQLVLILDTEEEVITVLKASALANLAVTFRAVAPVYQGKHNQNLF